MWMSKPENKEINSSNLMLRSMPAAKPGERQKRSRCFHYTCLCTRQLHHSPSGLWESSFGPCRLTLRCGCQDAGLVSICPALQSCTESLHCSPGHRSAARHSNKVLTWAGLHSQKNSIFFKFGREL